MSYFYDYYLIVMKDKVSTTVSEDVVFVKDVRELKGVKGLSNKKLCIIHTDFKDINKIKKFCKTYPNLETWLACENVSRENVITANLCGVKNIVEYPLSEELVCELFENKKTIEKSNKKPEEENFEDLKGLKVLILDDNQLNTELIEETLKGLGLNLISYQKPKEAAKIIDTESFDLFLLDIMMPDMSGFEFAELIQKTKINANKPIIFISALSDNEYKVKSFGLGSCAYIEKPFDIKVLKSQVCSLLRTYNGVGRKIKNNDSYFAMVIHDMKGPVQAELSALKLMLTVNNENLSDEQKEILEDVLNSTKYLQNLVSNILMKYKSDNGKIEIYKKLNSFKKLVTECCDEVKYFASEKNLHINVSYKSNVEDILFDYEEIKRVVNNLLTNGIKYSFKGREININIRDDGNNIIFSIENFGIGIDEKSKNDVFNKFTSYCEKQKSVNVGLGLYISKQILEAHGGQISFDSVPNEKTTVTFTLPINL